MASNPAPADYVTESESDQLQKKSEAVKPPTSSSEWGKERSKLKRPYADVEIKKKKKKKKKVKVVGGVAEKKINLFERVWSEEDEIVLVRGMADYWSEKKSNPMSDLNDFHEFIKKDLRIDVSRSQVQDKIRRLKKKYENNKNKERQSFSKAHEQKLYDVSSRIWGRGCSASTHDHDETKTKPKASHRVGDVSQLLIEKESSFGAKLEERMLKEGMKRFGEGENEWRRLMTVEMELFNKFLLIRLRQTQLVVNAMLPPNLKPT